MRSGLRRLRDLLELESVESSFEVMLCSVGDVRSVLDAGGAALVGTTGEAVVDELLVLLPGLLPVVASSVDGTFVGFIGNDVFTQAVAACWSIECNSAGVGGLRLRVGLWLGGTGVRSGESVNSDL